jgi:hypothetical protein
VLHRALERGVENETLARNVATVISPPKVEKEEIEILSAEEVGATLAKLQGHDLYSIAALPWQRGCAAANCWQQGGATPTLTVLPA